MYLDGEEKLTSSHIPRFCYDVDPDQDGKGGQGLFFSRLPRLVSPTISCQYKVMIIFSGWRVYPSWAICR